MKTALVTTCWLDNKDYLEKTQRWVDYYAISKLYFDNIILLDNASKFENIKKLYNLYGEYLVVQRFTEHMPRASHLEYPYLWRAVDFYKDLFQEYDKIIYMDNDFYIRSDKMFNWVNNINSGWHSPWCHRHSFPETGLQIITKDCEEYNRKYPWKGYNGTTMETTLPVTVNRDMIGDRHSEFLSEIPKDADFSAQVTLNMEGF